MGKLFPRGHGGRPAVFRGALLSATFALITLNTFNARGATETWNPNGTGGGNGTWDAGITPDWDSGIVWTDGNDALFGGTGGTVTVVTPSANSLTFSATGAYSLTGGTLTLTGSDVTVDGDATIASNITAAAGMYVTGTAELTVTGSDSLGSNNLTMDSGTVAIFKGGVVSGSSSYIANDTANDTGSTGKVIVSGSGSVWKNSGDLCVGNYGSGSLLVSDGGAVSNGYNSLGGAIGNGGGSSGTVTVTGTGSTWFDNGDLCLGADGTGALLISSGGEVTNNEVVFGASISRGMATVTGTGSRWIDNGALYLGGVASGLLFVSGGGAVSDASASLGVAAGGSGIATVTGSSSSWTNSGSLYVGFDAHGTVLISNGGALSDAGSSIALTLGGGGGMVTVTGAGSTWTNSGGITIGEYGDGVLLISDGGAVHSVGANLGYYRTGSIGMVTVTGSGSRWVSNADIYVGESGTGAVVISDAGSVSDFNGWIGDNAGSLGRVLLTGSGSIYNNDAMLFVGEGGTGGLAIANGGTVSSGSGGILGDQAGSTGIVTVSGPGATWSDGGDLVISNSGSGTLAISSGGAVSNFNGWIGDGAGSVGLVSVSGTGSTWTNNNEGGLYEGNYGSGTLLIANGGAVSDQSGSIGNGAGSSGTVTVSGSGSILRDVLGLIVGGSGTGTLAISNGGAVSDGNGSEYDIPIAAIGDFAGSSGTATVSGTGSIWTIAGDLDVGVSGSGTLQIIHGGSVSNGVSETGATIAFSPGSSGSATVSGSGSRWMDDGDLYVGEFGVGSLLVSNGGAMSGNDGFIGYFFGSHGTVTVTGGGSKWTNTGPVFIGELGIGTLVISSGGVVSSSGNYPNYLGFNGGSSGLMTVTGSGSTWRSNGNLTIGESGAGTLTISNGGDVSNGGPGVIGDQEGSSGTVTVTGSGSAWTNNGEASVGNSGTGALLISHGGAVSDLNGYIGENAGASGFGAVSGTGSQWTSTGNILVGGSGAGALTITAGGRVSVTGTTIIGDEGILQFDGSGQLETASLNVSGGVLWTIGAANFAKSVTVGAGGVSIETGGFNSTFSGSFTGPGRLVKLGAGILTLTGSSSLGANLWITGSGGVQISGGGLLADSTGYIGDGGSSTAAVSGTASKWINASNLYVGYIGAGTLAVTSGGAVSNANGYLGVNAGSNGTVTVSGSGSIWRTAGNLAVGYSGTGILVINNSGGVTCEGDDFIGYNAGSTGTVKVSGTGSTWTNAQGLVIGDQGAGTLTVVNGARVSVAGAMTIGSGGTLEFDGVSTFDTGSLAINGGALVTLAPTTFALSATLGTGGVRINSDNSGSTFSGNFSGVGGITKVGGGKVDLIGASTYTGATTVNAGTLALTTAAHQTASLGNSAINVASGATFAATLSGSPFSQMVNAGTMGSGSAGATLTLAAGSTFSMAGDSIASFNLRQESSFAGSAFTIGGASGIAPSLIFDIGNAAAGTDMIDVTKTVSVLQTGGEITIDALAGDTSLTAGSYDLITSAGGFSGSNGNGLALSGTTLAIGGSIYDLSLAHSTADDEILTVSASPAAPESSFTGFEDSTAGLPVSTPTGRTAAPPVATVSVPEPGCTLNLLSTFVIATAWHLRRRRK